MKGLLIIISAPSGVGKTTLIKRLLEVEPTCELCVSHTTRPKRANETEGVDYYFVSDETFDQMIAAGAFVEWAEVHGHRYGTSEAEVERLRALGRDIVFEVDFQGGRALMRRFSDAVSIFLLPPSLAEVKRRLEKRGSEAPESLALRLHNAKVEIAATFEYRYAVVNDNLEKALADVRTILAAERLRSHFFTDAVRALIAEKI